MDLTVRELGDERVELLGDVGGEGVELLGDIGGEEGAVDERGGLEDAGTLAEVTGLTAAAEVVVVALSDSTGAGAEPPSTALAAPQLDGGWMVAGWVLWIGLHPGRASTAVPDSPMSSAGETISPIVHLFIVSCV